MPVSRRKARSARITGALAILAVATLLVGGSLFTGDPMVLGIAGMLGVVGGWVAVQLAWSSVLESRYEHAVDRTRLARTYRGLFAERAVEQHEFVAVLAGRLATRDLAIHDLRGSLVVVEMRAVEAETSLSTYRRRLTDAEGQIVTMGDLITRNLMEPQAAGKPPLLGRPRSESLRDEMVPEWADMESDPVDALVAWEEYAGHVAGRHSAPDDSATEDRATRTA
ncbi:MAG: hypothetical protein ACR2FG_01280 [Marmoricola sp.]